jgi:hypothetical protein
LHALGTDGEGRKGDDCQFGADHQGVTLPVVTMAEMRSLLNHPASTFGAAIASLWVRIVLFIAACCGGTTLASLIRPSDDLPGLMPLLYAGVAWLVSPLFLAADVLALILLIVLLRTETAGIVIGSLIAVSLVWFGHGMLLWLLWG